MWKSIKTAAAALAVLILSDPAAVAQSETPTQGRVQIQQPLAVEGGNTTTGGALTPRSGSSDARDLQNFPRAWTKLPNTVLSVKRSGTLNEQWGNYWSDDVDSTADYPVIIDFRWITREQNLSGASWQVSRTADFSNISGSSPIPVPEPGEYSRFSIDLRPYISAGGGIYHVRVQPTKGGAQAGSFYALVESSTTVRVNDQWPEPQTQFDQLPKLTVVFDRILVEDDGDDLSAGDLGFGFWVHNQGPEVHVADVSSGDDTHPGISFTIENPPNVIQVRVFGVDNDEMEMMPIGPFVMFILPTCGALAGPSDDCPGDSAEGTYAMETGMRTGITKPETPFVLHANGPVLEFEVEGRYWLNPY